LSFPIIQEFETLMKESIKEVINIHKFAIFFLILRELTGGPARTAGQSERAAGLRAHYPNPPHVFLWTCGPGPRTRPNCHP